MRYGSLSKIRLANACNEIPFVKDNSVRKLVHGNQIIEDAFSLCALLSYNLFKFSTSTSCDSVINHFWYYKSVMVKIFISALRQ